MDKTMDKREGMILEIEKNHVLYDKADKDYKDIMKKRDIWKAIGQKVELTGLQCPVCTHVTLINEPFLIEKSVNVLLKPFKDEECIQEMEGLTPKEILERETCQPGKDARCSFYSGTVTMNGTWKIPAYDQYVREITFRVHHRGCYYPPETRAPSNGCHNFRNLTGDKTAFQKVTKDLLIEPKVYSFDGLRCLWCDTPCVSVASLCSQVSLNSVIGSISMVLMLKYL